MSTNLTTTPVRPVAPQAPVWRSWVEAWNRFWFTPSDPTLLALIRICCGALAVYTLIAYTGDLQEFMGKNAWMNHEFRELGRHQEPLVREPLNWPQSQNSELLSSMGLNKTQYKMIEAYVFSQFEFPDQQFLKDKAVGLSDEQLRKFAYVEHYIKKWKQPPPLPFPKDEAEAASIDDFIETWGVDPRIASIQGAPVWSIWFHVTDPKSMMLVHCLFIVVTFLFTIGLATRVTSAMAWFAAICYVHRSPISVFGVDTMMLILLLYLMIAPCGGALSVDRLIARWWRRRHRPAGAPELDDDDPVKPTVTANLALRMLQIHVCFVYAAAGLSKLFGASWWQGTAIWGTLANSEFAPVQLGWYMYLLQGMAARMWFVWSFLAFGTYFTLFFEISYPYLIWGKRTRWLMLFMAVMLHGVIGLFMGLKTFALMMLVMNMAFLPPETVQWLVGLFKRWGQDLTPRAKKPVPALAATGGTAAAMVAASDDRTAIATKAS